MNNVLNTSNNLIFALVVYSNTILSIAPAKNRCEADLSRVNAGFCLTEQNAAVSGAAPRQKLNYQWSLNDDVFDLTSRVCLTAAGLAGERQDIVVALDRSRSVWGADAAGAKEGSFNISATRLMLETLKNEYQSKPDKAPKFGIMMFSSDDTCEQYSSGAISVNRIFPCMYIPAKSVVDAQHVTRVLAMLTAAEGKYSQGGENRGADYRILAKALTDNAFEIEPQKKAGLVLMSDGRIYDAPESVEYAYLRIGSYVKSQNDAFAAFSAAPLRRYKMIFALSPLASVAFGAIFADAYQNMCEMPNPAAEDCRPTIDRRNPATWPINQIDSNLFAKNLVSKNGGVAAQVVSLTTREAILPALEMLRYAAGDTLRIDSASFSVDGTTYKPAIVSGDRVRFETLPFDDSLDATLLLKSGPDEIKIPVHMVMAKAQGIDHVVNDKEMVCSSAAPAPKLSLKNLQGGSASCGVVGGETSGHSGWFFVLAPLLLLAVFCARRLVGVTAVLLLTFTGIFGLGAVGARAEDGLNVLQYRPVVDGVGSAERATTVAPRSYNVGLFVDFANDALELGNEKGERDTSVVDNLTTTHIVMNAGLFERLSLGIHVPVVARNDLHRETGGGVDSGKITGKASDSAVLLKYHVARAGNVDFGLMPIVSLPTGQAAYLTGDGSANYGLLALVSGSAGRFGWAADFGYIQRSQVLELEDERAETVNIRGQFVNYSGISYSYGSALSFAGNMQFKISAGEGLSLSQSSPAEWMASVNYRPMSGLDLSAGGGTGIGKGYGAPDYRVVVGVAYIPQPKAYTPAPQVAAGAAVKKK